MRGWARHQQGGHGDQYRDGRLEHAAGQREEEDGSGQSAEEGGPAQLDHPPALADQLPTVGHHGADAPGDQAHRVGHVGQHRGIAQGQQGGEGDQRPRTHDDVDRPGRQSGGEDGQGVQR